MSECRWITQMRPCDCQKCETWRTETLDRMRRVKFFRKKVNDNGR